MRTLRWGLIGCGDIARRRVAPALRDLPNCELVAVSRARYHLAESFAKDFGAKKWYQNWQDVCADEEIEAVYIATPVHLHAAQAVAAAEAGKHVLCEKPMAITTGECERMIAAGRDNNVKMGIAYYRHFYPVIDRIKAILKSGEIGESIVVQINAFELFNPRSDHPRYWLMKKGEAGGGPMFDFGCHRIEVLMNILGPLKCSSSVVCNVLFDREVEDTSVALFQSGSGACSVLTVTHAVYEPQDTLDIYGSLGSIHVAVLNNAKIRIINADGERIEDHPPASNTHQPLIADFVEAVFDDREPKVDGIIGREVAKIEEAIYLDAHD